MDGMTLYRKIEKIDDTVRVCLTTADKNYIQELRKEITDIEKNCFILTSLIKDLKNEIDSLLLLSRQEVNGNQL